MLNKKWSWFALCFLLVLVFLVLTMKFRVVQTVFNSAIYNSMIGIEMLQEQNETTYKKGIEMLREQSKTTYKKGIEMLREQSKTTYKKGIEMLREQSKTTSKKGIEMLREQSETTYNKDLGILRREGFVANLADIDLTKLTTKELLLTLHSYLDNTDIVCRRKIRLGNLGDGGWEVCDDPDVRPRVPCIIYSFGINNDFSFDDEAATAYGCHVYSFDPSMNQETYNRSMLVHFYKIGLSYMEFTNSQLWQLRTLGGLRSMLGHTNQIIDIVKMDMENYVWDAISEMVRSGQLKTVRQLLIEFHVVNTTREYLLSRLQIIKSVETAGFKRFYAHKNPACKTQVAGVPVLRTNCYEIYYMRR